MNLKGGNLIFKYVIVCLLVMFVIVHGIELFSTIVMYLELLELYLKSNNSRETHIIHLSINNYIICICNTINNKM